MDISIGDTTDLWRREAQTFPHLSGEMIDSIRTYGHEEIFENETLVFERGDRAIDFFCALEGHIPILAEDFRKDRIQLYIGLDQVDGSAPDNQNDETFETHRSVCDKPILRVTIRNLRAPDQPSCLMTLS
ncbi:hypothetical protein LP421_04400 (plasmid) [Rhizobium sp. RCAM05350]|nr:hypothetical protein LP421_04400 [Rhizobium sp. RCAM05350]